MKCAAGVMRLVAVVMSITAGCASGPAPSSDAPAGSASDTPTAHVEGATSVLPPPPGSATALVIGGSPRPFVTGLGPGCRSPGDDAPPPEFLAREAELSRERPEIVLRFHRQAPVRCNAQQTNTPCLYSGGAACLLRGSNCTGKPCSEGDPVPMACDCAAPALVKPKLVCLLILGPPDGATIRLFHDQQFSERGAGGPTDGAGVKLCGQTDRRWHLEVNSRSGRFDAALDWTRDTCHTLDLAKGTVRAGCDAGFHGKTFENGL